MKKSFISLFLLTLILSHFSILNLWGADYLIPVTPGTNCYDGSENKTEYNRRKIYIGKSGDWADLNVKCPSNATYIVYAGHLTPNSGNLHLYIKDADQGAHPLQAHDWNTVDETNCGSRGFTAGNNKISLRYNNAGYNATYIRLHDDNSQSTKTVPTSLDFYWDSKQESGDGAKVILNSDFMYDQLGEDYIKKATQGGVNYAIFNANTTASSRSLVCFPATGTYTFTFHVYASETNSDYQKPYVFVNSFMAGGGTFSLNNGSTTDIVIEMDVTAGTYPIAFYIPYSNHADRYHLSTVSIAQKVSCTAPNHVDISGNYHFFPGETISLTATAYSSAGTGSPIDDEDITGYQWQKNIAGVYTDIAGATSATYTKSNATTSDVGQYKCIVSTGEGCSRASSVFDAKCLQLYLYYNDKTDKYNLPFTKVDDTHATASVLLDNGSYTYYYKITDGCNDWWGNNETMNSGNCTGWNLDVNNHCGLKTSKSATYQFNLTYNAALNSFSMSVVYPSTVQTGGYNIYFDNSFTNWTTSKIYYRIGRNNYNSKAQMTLVPGTAHLFTTTTIYYENDGGFEAWHIANNGCWSEGTSIYKTNTGDTWAATQAMRFEGSPVSSSGITIVPVDEHWTGTGDASNCEFYSYGSSSGLLTHTATISDMSNGSVRLNWTDIDDEAQTATTTTSGLAHTCNLQVTAVPDTGYETATLTVDGEDFTSGNTHVLSADATIAATFSLIDYNVTYSAPSNGSYTISVAGGAASGATKTANYNQTVSIVATPSDGYAFSSWTITKDGGGTVAPASNTASTSFTMPTDGVTITATFVALPTYTVTVNRNNISYGSASTTDSPAYEGKTVNISATPNTGYRFVNWETSDGVTFDDANSASTYFTMPAKAVTVQANFDLVDNVIISGASNSITDKGWSGNGGSMTITSGNTDATCVFDHNVLKIDYSGLSTSNAYCSKCIEDNSDYSSSLSDGATGFGFYYRTMSSSDAVAFVLEYNTSSHNQYKKLLAATNGVWKYAYLPISAADEWNSGEVVIFMNHTTNATDGGAEIHTANASGTFYIADLAATAITSKSDISNTAHTVSVSSNNDSYGTASISGGGTSFYDCNSVTVNAEAEDGYGFVNWTQGGSEVSTDEDYTFTMEDLRGDASSVTLVANFEEVSCSSSRTYQVEDILIAAGSVTCDDVQADGANTLVVNSTTNTSSSHYSEYMSNESGPYGGGYVMNTAAGKTIYMEVDIPLAGSYDIALWYGKNNGSDKVEWLNIYTRTWTSYKTLTYGGNTYHKLEYDGYRVSSTASSSYYISTTPYERTNLSLPAGKIVIGIWSESANAVYDQIRITRHDDSDVFCKHDITVNTTTGASADATASVSKALSGTRVMVTAAPASAGYEFTGWTVTSGSATFADASALSTTFVMPDADVTVQANYASSGYVVKYEVEGGNGTITSVKDGSGNDISNGDAVASGTVLTFTASPSSGYAVLGWYTYLNSTETLQGNTQNSNTFNYEVTGDITIRVKFATPYTLTLNSSPAAASATVSGDGSYVQTTVVSVSTSTENGDYTFVHWMGGESEVISTSAVSNYVMPASNKTLTAVWRLSRISSLSWAGSEDLGSGMEIASSCFDGGCFDTDVTFTFMGGGTVNYYANNDHEKLLGTVYSGTAITLDDDLREHGIYIKCTSGDATLTEVSKTTVGSVYTIWSGSVNVSADYTGIDENGDEVKLEANAGNDWWLQQVVLGPEHFQTAAVGDTLRVTYIDKANEFAKGAIQTATKYSAIPGNIYDESDGSQVTTNTHDFVLPNSGYYHIITAGSLDSLQHKGIVVKGKGHTITRVSLHASCSNLSLRTTAPDVATRSGVDIMTSSIDFGVDGFDLGNWEHQVELDESCFTNVTVGSIINLYMSVAGDATLSFRCNVSSIIADDKRGGVGCPSYGDISFDRTIDDLYGNTPSVVGETGGYKVMYLKVDADMERRLKETGMILCGKGTLIKVVEGVEDTVTVMPNENKPVPTVVNNIVIYQGGQVTNEEDIMVLGSITYIRHAKGGALSNKLDQWYTFALPFTVSDVEVLDTDGKWYDINAVYYSNDATDQATNDPDGAGHYYLQYLKAENETAIGRDFAARWQYITPGHSERIYAYGEDRYGYPKKDSAFIILFDSDQPSELPSGYWDSNPTIRFVGVGPQTIDGVAKKWQVEADGEQYWMYANNTLHSFTLSDAYILNDAGTEFVLQESPTIRPFECYVQATASLKKKRATIPMRGFHIDNTTTGAESIQGSAIRAEKILRNGQLIIIRNGVEYDATGVVIR